MADRYWVAGSANWNSTASWSATSGGASGASIPTASDNVIFDRAVTSTVTVSSGATASCANFTASAGTVAISASGATSINITGSIDLTGSSGGVLIAGAPPINFGPSSGGSGVLTYRMAGRPISSGGAVLTFRNNASLTYRLLDDLTMNNTVSDCVHAGGTLDLNGFTLTSGTFTSSNTASRSIAAGSTGRIVVNAQGGTPFALASGSPTVTGSLSVVVTNASGSATTINLSVITTPISFAFPAGSYSLTFLSNANARAQNIDFTGFAGTWAARTNTQSVYGNITLSAGMTYGASSGVMSLLGTSGTQTITTNGKTFDNPITVNTAGATVQLAGALTMGATRALTLTNGTFDGAGYTISGAASFTMTTGSVIAKNINTALAFTHSSGTLTFDANNTTGAYTHTAGTLDLAGYQLTCTTFASNNVNTRTLAFGTGNITCTGSGTAWTTSSTTGLTITGTPVVNITYSGAVTTIVTPGALPEASTISFNFTAGTYALSFLGSSGNTAKNVNFTGFAGTWNARTVTAFVYGSLTLSAGMTFAAATGGITLGATSGTQLITTNGTIVDTPLTADGIGGTVRLADALTMTSSRVFTLVNGALDLNEMTLTVGRFASSNSNVRSIAFGASGTIVAAGSGTAFDLSTVTNVSITGNPQVRFTNSGATATTFGCGTLPDGQKISLAVTAGTYAFSGGVVKSIDFTGFTGSVSTLGNIYGNLTLGAGMTCSPSSGLVFRGTSNSNTITANGVSVSSASTSQFNCGAGTYKLMDALSIGASFQHVSGTLDLNGKTLTIGVQYVDSGTAARNITFNGGTILLPNSGTVWQALNTGLTTTAGTGVGKISLTGVDAKTFIGSGYTYNCTLSNDSTSALTVSGNNTFTTIANGIQPTTFLFQSGNTQTITNWNVSGTAESLVTVKSGTAGSSATISKANGIVSADYLIVQDIAATGGATWYAGANSTNVSGNSGWIFSAAPVVSTVTFEITEPQDTSAIGIAAETSAALAATDPPDTSSFESDVSGGPVTVTLEATEAPDVATFEAHNYGDFAFYSNAFDQAGFFADVPDYRAVAIDATEPVDQAAATVDIASPVQLVGTEAHDIVSASVDVASPASADVTESLDTASGQLDLSSRGVLQSSEPNDQAAIGLNIVWLISLSSSEAPDVVSLEITANTAIQLSVAEPPDTAAAEIDTYTLTYEVDGSEQIAAEEEIRTILVAAPVYQTSTDRQSIVVEQEDRIMYVPAKTTDSLAVHPSKRAVA